MNSSGLLNRWVLIINKKKIELVKWENQKMLVIRDGVFPIPFKDEYEYSKSSRGTSFGFALKNYEKDKSIVKKERFSHLLRLTNEKIKAYLEKDSVLYLAGTDNDRSAFKRISNYNHLIEGEVSGSYSSNHLSQLHKSLISVLTHSAGMT